MRNVNAARSAPAAVSTTQGMNFSSVAGSKYSRFSPDALRVAAEVEVAAIVDALELLPAEREAVLDVDRLLGVVGQLVGRVLAEAQPLRASRRSARTRRDAPAATPRRRAAAGSPGATKYCISICSNSRIRKTKLPGLISLRNDLPIWAMPKGTFLRLACWTDLKFT